jgi:hypothetical protein
MNEWAQWQQDSYTTNRTGLVIQQTTTANTNGLLIPSMIQPQPQGSNVKVVEPDGDPPPRFNTVEEADEWMERRAS